MAVWDNLMSEHDKKVDSYRKFRQQDGVRGAACPHRH